MTVTMTLQQEVIAGAAALVAGYLVLRVFITLIRRRKP